MLDHPGVRALRPDEALMLRTAVARQRAALGEIGAPLTAESFETDAPRRGILAT